MSLVGPTLSEEIVCPMEVVQDPHHPIALVEPDREMSNVIIMQSNSQPLKIRSCIWFHPVSGLHHLTIYYPVTQVGLRVFENDFIVIACKGHH